MHLTWTIVAIIKKINISKTKYQKLFNKMHKQTLFYQKPFISILLKHDFDFFQKVFFFWCKTTLSTFCYQTLIDYTISLRVF